MPRPQLQRSTTGEKDNQIQRLKDFQVAHAAEAPAMRERLRQAVIKNENVFAVLMDAVRCCSLGQISDTLFEVGGQYRRNM
jgi:methylmalonyl-CoA mutase